MPSWNWDEQADSEGVVHQSVANTDNDDATKLKQGYDYANFSEITPNPVACWPLHEDSGTTAYDKAGTNDGTISGATISQTGLLGTSAYSFDGVDDYVNTNYSVGASPITVSAWVYPAPSDGNLEGNGSIWGSYDGTNQTILTFDDATGDPDNSIQFKTFDGTIHRAISPAGTITQNEWQHVVGTYDGSTYRVFHNGVEVGSNADSTFVTPTNNQYIGKENRASKTNPHEGRIADVRIYDTALTQSQIQILYDVVRASGDWLGTGKVI